MQSGVVRVIVGLGVALLGVASACSSGAADGEPCTQKSDCESNICSIGGKCGTGDCACTGEECGKVQSTCAAGQVCYRGFGATDSDYAVCRLTCSTDRPCPSGQICDGLFCEAGGPPFTLAWDSFPRPAPCAPKSSCFYQVHPTDPAIKVEKYTWTFEGRPEDGEDQTGHVYGASGTYPVSVSARTADGRVGKLTGTEDVCALLGDSCTLTGPVCCTGSCSRQIDRCE